MQNNDRVEEIYRISNELNVLARRLNQLLILEDAELETTVPVIAVPAEAQPQQQPPQEEPQQAADQPQPPLNEDNDNQLRIGRRAIILNNYQGLRGSTGVIGSVTRLRVTVRLDNSNRIVTRAHHNVRVID